MSPQQIHIIDQVLRQFGVWMTDEQITLLADLLARRGLVIEERPE